MCVESQSYQLTLQPVLHRGTETTQTVTTDQKQRRIYHTIFSFIAYGWSKFRDFVPYGDVAIFIHRPGEVTSQNLWPRYDRHFVGIT